MMETARANILKKNKMILKKRNEQELTASTKKVMNMTMPDQRRELLMKTLSHIQIKKHKLSKRKLRQLIKNNKMLSKTVKKIIITYKSKSMK